MAYNEEGNIGRLLEAISYQEHRVSQITEIIVVASGCTDKTVRIVEEHCRQDPRIILLVQPRREGKTSAINQFITRASSEVLIMQGGDTIPSLNTIDHLVMPFEDPYVGMVGGRAIPINDKKTFVGFAGHLIWQLHHQMSLSYPKCGEIVAWRNCLDTIPPTSVDEATIEALVLAKGLKLAYAPEAVIHNCAPLNIVDFVKQRRRIWAGHLQMKRKFGYNVSTLSMRHVLRCLVTTMNRNIKSIIWTFGVMALELYARFLGTLDVIIWQKDHTIWDMVESTKVVQDDIQ